MSQPDPNHRTASPAAVGRLAALGGLGFAVASIVGDLVTRQPRPHLTHATVPAKEVRHA